MIAVIGAVKKVTLSIYQGADLRFDIGWFQQDGTTPINMSAIAAKVKNRYGGTTLLDIGAHTTIDNTTPNIAHVAVPASLTATLAAGSGVWDLKATAASSGEVKKLMRGYARIFAGATE